MAQQMSVFSLQLVDALRFDIIAKCFGGGVSGQAGALLGDEVEESGEVNSLNPRQKGQQPFFFVLQSEVQSVWRWREPCKSTISIGGPFFQGLQKIIGPRKSPKSHRKVPTQIHLLDQFLDPFGVAQLTVQAADEESQIPHSRLAYG